MPTLLEPEAENELATRVYHAQSGFDRNITELKGSLAESVMLKLDNRHLQNEEEKMTKYYIVLYLYIATIGISSLYYSFPLVASSTLNINHYIAL